MGLKKSSRFMEISYYTHIYRINQIFSLGRDKADAILGFMSILWAFTPDNMGRVVQYTAPSPAPSQVITQRDTDLSSQCNFHEYTEPPERDCRPNYTLCSPVHNNTPMYSPVITHPLSAPVARNRGNLRLCSGIPLKKYNRIRGTTRLRRGQHS